MNAPAAIDWARNLPPGPDDWDDCYALFARASQDLALPPSVRDAIHLFLSHQDEYGNWTEWYASDLDAVYAAEGHACNSLRDFRSGRASATDVIGALANVRAQYVCQMIVLPRSRKAAAQ